MNILKWLQDWATPLSALATLAAVIVALGLGVSSIIQTQKLQKREKRERELNEIIEWAEKVLGSGYSENLDHTKLGQISNQQQEFAYIYEVVSRISTNYENMKIKSIYIKNVAALLGEEMLGDVTTLSNYIIDYSKEIDYILGTSEKGKENIYKLKYNNPGASEEIKRRMSSSKEILINQPEKMDLLAGKIIKQAINVKMRI